MGYPISGSNSFIDTLRYGSALVEGQIEIYSGGITTGVIVPISKLDITVDRNAEFRRSGSFTAEIIPEIPPLPIMPTNPYPGQPGSLLTPFGNEVTIGVGIGTATDESGSVMVINPPGFVPLGVYELATVLVDDNGIDTTITCDVYDRSWVISRRAFINPYTFPATAGGYFDAEIEALIQFVWTINQATGALIPNMPTLQYNIAPAGPNAGMPVVPAASYDQGSDPWQAALDMAGAVGYELFFDLNGNVTAFPIPDPLIQPITWNFTDDPTAVFGAGGSGSGGGSAQLGASVYSTPVEVQNAFTQDGIYNDIYITGTGTTNAPASNTGSDAPILSERADISPPGYSPTSVYGAMGDIPEFVSSNLTISSNQAIQAATSDLLTAISAAWQITISFAPNPIFDIDDVVSITRPRVGLGSTADPNAAIRGPLVVIDQINYVVSYADLCTLTGRVLQPLQVIGPTIQQTPPQL